LATKNFIRKYELTVSKPTKVDKTKQKLTPEKTENVVISDDKASSDLRAVDKSDAIILSDLHIDAKISNNNSSGSSTCTITIYNLSEFSLSYMSSNSVIILKAGYKGDSIPIVFTGQVSKVQTKTVNGSKVTELNCKEAYTPASSLKISKKFPVDTTYESILIELAAVYARNGIPIGRDIDSLRDKLGDNAALPINEMKVKSGYSVLGTLQKVLDSVCKECGFVNYISNGKLYIEPSNNTIIIDQFTLDKGKIRSLQKRNTSQDTTSKDTTKNVGSGYTVELLCDGRMEIGKYIKLTEKDIKGTFKITNVNHNLSFEGRSWFTTVEVIDSGINS
jgi:hypothetical protein